MRHRKRGRKLNRTQSHRRSLMRNLARALILSKDGRIITTEGKAKEARPFVERMVTLARHGDEASRRRAVALMGEHAPSDQRSANADKKGAAKWARIPAKPRNPKDRKRWRREGLPALPAALPVMAVEKLFGEIAAKLKDRPGGYTRILKIGKKRLSDKAELVLLEFVVPMGETLPSPEPTKQAAAKT